MPRSSRASLSLEPLEARCTPAAVAGLLDKAFSGDGLASVGFSATSTDSAQAVAFQEGGKIVVVGSTQTANRDFAIARYLRDGSLDGTFGSEGKVVLPLDLGGSNDDVASAVVLQPDGKIVVAGTASTADAGDDFVIVRLTTTGSLDPTFGTNGVARIDFNALPNRCRDVALTAQGKIVVVGTNVNAPGDRIGVAQLTTTGQLDTGFGNQGRLVLGVTSSTIGRHDRGAAVAVRPSTGKIVVGANTFDVSRDTQQFAFLQLNSDGSFDRAFGTSGIVSYPLALFNSTLTLRDVAIQADGKLVAVGDANFGTSSTRDDRVVVARVNADGKALDNTFGTVNGTVRKGFTSHAFNSISENEVGDGVLVQPDGKIVVGASFTPGLSAPAKQLAVYRFTKDGALDTSFGTGGKMTLATTPLSLQTRVGVAIGNDGLAVVGSLQSATGDDVGVLRLLRDAWIVTATGAGPVATVRVLTATEAGTVLFELQPYGATFRGGVQVALADLNKDGIPEIVCAPGKGHAAEVRIFDGFTRQQIGSFRVFNGVTDGVNLAVGNVLDTWDNKPCEGVEIVVARSGPSAPMVQIYSAATATGGKPIREFLAYPTTYQGGVRLAVGDVRSTHLEEIITAPQAGHGPMVRIFSGNAANLGYQREIVAFDSQYKGGVNVTVGNYFGAADSKKEILVSPLEKSSATLKVKGYLLGDTAASDHVFATYQPLGATSVRGVRVSGVDVNGDGLLDLIATSEQAGLASLLVKKSQSTDAVWTLVPFATTVTATMTTGLSVVGDCRC